MTFLVDPLVTLYGPLRPLLLPASRFKEEHDVTFVSCFVSENYIKKLEDFKAIGLDKRPLLPESLATLEGWLRKSEFKSMDDEIVLNFSQCFLANAHIYYAQGPVTRALNDIHSSKRIYRCLQVEPREPITLEERIGMALIIAGILLIEKG